MQGADEAADATVEAPALKKVKGSMVAGQRVLGTVKVLLRAFVCVPLCLYACMHVCMYACMCVWMFVRVYVCMYVRVYVCMYVCSVDRLVIRLL